MAAEMLSMAVIIVEMFASRHSNAAGPPLVGSRSLGVSIWAKPWFRGCFPHIGGDTGPVRGSSGELRPTVAGVEQSSSPPQIADEQLLSLVRISANPRRMDRWDDEPPANFDGWFAPSFKYLESPRPSQGSKGGPADGDDDGPRVGLQLAHKPPSTCVNGFHPGRNWTREAGDGVGDKRVELA
jgi:hypothetical protein